MIDFYFPLDSMRRKNQQLLKIETATELIESIFENDIDSDQLHYLNYIPHLIKRKISSIDNYIIPKNIKNSFSFLNSLKKLMDFLLKSEGRKNPMYIFISGKFPDNLFSLIRMSDNSSISSEEHDILREIVQGFKKAGLDVLRMYIKIKPKNSENVYSFTFTSGDYLEEEHIFDFWYNDGDCGVISHNTLP